MDNQTRITPEMVIEAYMKTGLKPAKNLFVEDGCACAIGALFTAAGQDSDNAYDHEIVDWAKEQTKSNDYPYGFMAGFDGGLFKTSNEESNRGIEDGKAAWEAVKHLSEGAEA
jgi:hypothetical protein